MLLVVLSPIVQNFREEPVDGFPLSYFPMFTAERDGRTTLVHPIGIRADGSTVDLSYRVAGSGGMNLVRRQVRARVLAGGAGELCREVAGRMGRSRWGAAYPGVVEVAIVRDRYRFDEFFAGEHEPYRRDVLARLALARDEGVAGGGP